jgi:hypothetical protein
VELYLDSILVQSLTNPPYLATVSLAGPQIGGHKVQARAIGQYGLVSLSAEVWFELIPAPPANDLFSNRLPLAGFLLSVPANSEYATREAGEPDPFAAPGDGTLWWTWTAPASGLLKVQSSPGYWASSLLSVWIGSTLAQLHLVATNAGGAPELIVSVNRGGTYQIACARNRGPLALFLDAGECLVISRASFNAASLFHLELETLAQRAWVIEASTDLSQWLPLSTNSTLHNVFDFVDLESGLHPRRFYRVTPEGQ